jgi:hypothetical protein
MNCTTTTITDSLPEYGVAELEGADDDMTLAEDDND